TAATELSGDPGAADSIMHETWDVERAPTGAKDSLTPSVPSDSSGVTLGRGYDMGARSAATIEAELGAAGVDEKLAKKYRGAAKKRGDDARKWIKKNKPFAAITADQEKTLFRQEYQQVSDETVRFLADPSRGYTPDGDGWKLQVNFKDLNPKILAFLVDLKFRGDLNDSSWAYIRDAVVANSLETLQPLVADAKKHKKFFYNNYNRYLPRCNIVGASPVTEKEWNKK
ncbi:MAG TPA: pesticin C-terminus-like muramidase, partial [Kofleriaceae bacterium]|nr:pesticin C-terminus-like muramidase [Kofleriaceae bacterium]